VAPVVAKIATLDDAHPRLVVVTVAGANTAMAVAIALTDDGAGMLVARA
jgi:hypothetical protein